MRPSIRRCCMVDTISSLASIDYRHDEWGVDVTVAGSQKGLMLPPGLSLQRDLARRRSPPARARELPRSYWALGRDDRGRTGTGYFPYTPATNLLYGLREALDDAARGEGSTNVFARHERHARSDAARGARAGASRSLSRADRVQRLVDRGADARGPRRRRAAQDPRSLRHVARHGLGRLAGKVFRIGHLGDFNDLMLVGTLAGVEMGLALAEVPHKPAGVQAALDYLAGAAAGAR